MFALNHIVVKSLNVSKTCSSSEVGAQGNYLKLTKISLAVSNAYSFHFELVLALLYLIS